MTFNDFGSVLGAATLEKIAADAVTVVAQPDFYTVAQRNAAVDKRLAAAEALEKQLKANKAEQEQKLFERELRNKTKESVYEANVKRHAADIGLAGDTKKLHGQLGVRDNLELGQKFKSMSGQLQAYENMARKAGFDSTEAWLKAMNDTGGQLQAYKNMARKAGFDSTEAWLKHLQDTERAAPGLQKQVEGLTKQLAESAEREKGSRLLSSEAIKKVFTPKRLAIGGGAALATGAGLYGLHHLMKNKGEYEFLND